MAEDTQPLQALELALWGSRLIEASAGTGKTWTIATLYLRLVLGHGAAGCAWREPLEPSRILVMTFTRAATQELRERIRQRLAVAAACLRGAHRPLPEDPLLAELLRQIGDAPARELAAWRLALAADAMDDAAVFTIDAWCQRMLREHAFDSGSAFDEQLLTDESELRGRALRDVWRCEVYPLRDAALAGLLAVWPRFDAFERDIGRRVRRRIEQAQAAPQAAPGTAGALGTAWARVQEQRVQGMRALREEWDAELPVMRDWLCGVCAGAANPFDARKLPVLRVEAWFAALQRWRDAADGEPPALDDGAWERLQGAGLRGCLRKGRAIDIPQGFERLPRLRAQLQALPMAAPELAERACLAVEQRLAELKQQAHSFGFVDLQLRLAQALAGAGGARLRERILAQYPVALIDEFQDTSALQYGLFDSLYRLRDNDPQTAVLLIGDPKQSIYSFRGADIESYIQARLATTGRHYVLHTNYRSSQPLVAAVNRLFEQAEQRAGSGAFGWRDAGGNPLPFVAVAARGLPTRWVDGEGDLPVLRIEYGQALRSATQARAECAQACADHMVGRLNDPLCGLRGAQGLQALRLRDIAVLVRTRAEADCVRAELRRRGIASVYLSERESVFDSAEARGLLRLLRAVAAPHDARLARAAFASATLGLELRELQALADDDQVFERHAELLLELQQVWQRQGVLPMLRGALHRLQLVPRWLQLPDGERRLTNVLHLAELLQRASAAIDGQQALVRWFEHAQQGRVPTADEQQLRLESESDLVRVVTIHKAKGLEYEIVYLPFASHFRAADEDDAADAQSEADDPDEPAQPNDELRLREDLRLLYVALTRARQALWIGAAALSGRGGSCLLHASALGRLLGAESAASAPQWEELLGQALHGASGVSWGPLQPMQPPPRLRQAAAPAVLHPPAPYTAVFERDWSMASFSSMARDLAPLRAASGLPRPQLDAEGEATPERPPALGVQHAFARGAQAGSFLHQQLAWLAEQGFGDAAGVQQAFEQRCARLGWEAQAGAAWQWLQKVLDTRLPPLQASLRSLQAVLPEMEFWFPVRASSAQAIDSLCASRWLGTLEHARLDERSLHGLVMGFADLVFEHQGRYWVLDYKSNALGERDADYDRDALARAVAEHRYDVQAMLYLLALHRLLRVRLGARYEPRRQLGGALCLFLRGIEGPAKGCFAMPPDIDWLQRLDELLQQAAPGQAGTGVEAVR